MEKIYVAHTAYQLLISLIKIKKNDDLVIMNNVVSKDVVNKIRDYGYNVYEFSSKSFGVKAILDLKERKKMIEFFNRYKDIYLFLDHNQLGHFFNKYKIKYNLNEDGYNYYMYNTRYTRKIYDSFIKQKIYDVYFKPPVGPGFSEHCESIEINDLSVVPKDERYNKFIENPRKQMFNNLEDEKRNELLDIFNVQEFEKTKDNKSILVLTQPLFAQKVSEKFNTESKQVEYYRNIVDKYKNEYIVYFKIHPGDEADYSSFRDVVFLEKHVPMELYELIGNYEFDLGITYSSTAINFIDSVKEKIILNS